ncbi:hypothetical protein LINPERPRIM_LOCUS4689 [Linum perenne]
MTRFCHSIIKLMLKNSR